MTPRRTPTSPGRRSTRPTTTPASRRTSRTPPEPARPRRPGPVDAVRSLLALLALLAVLGAVPLALRAWRHNPLPHTWQPHRWWTLASQGFIDPQVIPNTLAVLGWAAWALFVLSVLRETAGLARRPRTDPPPAAVTQPGWIPDLASTAPARTSTGRPTRRRTPRPAQAGSSRLVHRWVTTAALVFTLASRAASMAAPALPAVALASSTAPATPGPAATGLPTPGTTMPGAGHDAPPAVPAPVGSSGSGYTATAIPGHDTGTIVRAGPYDTLRSLAAHYLGDPDRWREIADASAGVVQPDGSRLPAGTVVIHDGTILRLPATATTSTTLSPTSPVHTVRPGDTLTAIADGAYPSLTRGQLPAAVHDVFAANLGASDGAGHHLRNPDLLNPGERLTLPTLTIATPAPSGPTGPAAPNGPAHSPGPATPVPSPVTPPPSPGPSSTPAPATPPASTPAPSGPATHSAPPASANPAPAPTGPARPAASGHHTNRLAETSWILAGGLLTAAAVLSLRSRRRRRDQTVDPNSTPPPPDPDLVDLHTDVLRATDSVTAADRLDHALRSLTPLADPPAGHTAGSDPSGPRPQLVIVEPDQTIHVQLTTPVTDPPTPWATGGDRATLVLPSDATLPDVTDVPPLCPALVPLGTDPTGATIYLDLEAVGVLTIDAATPAGTVLLPGLARAVIAALTLSPYAGLPTVHTHGVALAGLAEDWQASQRLRPADSLTDLAAAVDADTALLTDTLTSTGAPSTFTARSRLRHDNFDPAIAVIATPAGPPEDAAALDALTRAAADRRGLALIAPARNGPAHPDSWRLTLHETEPALWSLQPAGLSLQPLTLAADELEALTALLADVETPPIARPVATSGPFPGAATGPIAVVEPDHADEPPPAPYADPAWQVMVRLLGPLDVVGADGRQPGPGLATDRTVEVLTWLATHRGRTRTDLEAAIWPRGTNVRSINNQLTRVRGLLADLAGPDARGWLPLRPDGTLTLDPAVVTDHDLLAARLIYARTHQDRPALAVPVLTSALELVRGTPADLPWLEAELGSTHTTDITSAVALLAGHQLAAGDQQAVLATTAIGLAVIPAHPALFALRIRARAAAHDRGGIKTEYHAFLRAEQSDPLTDGSTDRDLERLYNTLIGRDTDQRKAAS